MQFLIKIMSAYAVKLLETHTCGRVHSIYRKTVNLQFGSCLLSLQTDGSPLSPVSLITELNQEGMSKLRLAPGQPAICESNRIHITAVETSYSFSVSDARVVDLELKPPFSHVQKALIAKALSLSHAGGFGVLFPPSSHTAAGAVLSGNQELIISAARLRLDNCTHFFRQNAYEMAAQELSLLLGLGIGLTPSGDDFLCGVLAGLTFCGQLWHPFSRAFQDTLRGRLSDTNDISRTFLTCALHSQYSYAVISLPQAASPEEILAGFEAIGHSSGIDTLCGIYYGISLFS